MKQQKSTIWVLILVIALAPAGASAPIGYAWSPAPLTGQGTDTACYNWPQPGTYQLAVTATNCSGAGQAQDTLTVNVGGACVPVTGVDIAGPTTGIVGLPYAFDAVVAPPDAGTPIVYTWFPTPTSGQGSAHATYLWDTAGGMSIMVEVSNCGSPDVVYDIHNITITGGTVYHVYLPAIAKQSTP